MRTLKKLRVTQIQNVFSPRFSFNIHITGNDDPVIELAECVSLTLINQIKIYCVYIVNNVYAIYYSCLLVLSHLRATTLTNF